MYKFVGWINKSGVNREQNTREGRVYYNLLYYNSLVTCMIK